MIHELNSVHRCIFFAFIVYPKSDLKIFLSQRLTVNHQQHEGSGLCILRFPHANNLLQLLPLQGTCFLDHPTQYDSASYITFSLWRYLSPLPCVLQFILPLHCFLNTVYQCHDPIVIGAIAKLPGQKFLILVFCFLFFSSYP